MKSSVYRKPCSLSEIVEWGRRFGFLQVGLLDIFNRAYQPAAQLTANCSYYGRPDESEERENWGGYGIDYGSRWNIIDASAAPQAVTNLIPRLFPGKA
jgi:hypothetical protein